MLWTSCLGLLHGALCASGLESQVLLASGSLLLSPQQLCSAAGGSRFASRMWHPASESGLCCWYFQSPPVQLLLLELRCLYPHMDGWASGVSWIKKKKKDNICLFLGNRAYGIFFSISVERSRYAKKGSCPRELVGLLVLWGILVQFCPRKKRELSQSTLCLVEPKAVQQYLSTFLTHLAPLNWEGYIHFFLRVACQTFSAISRWER